MKVSKIEVINYRLLKKFSLTLEDELSLVLGKNNCGKTSILSILDKFINGGSFSFDDFNIDFKENLKKLIGEAMDEENYKDLGITLKLYIDYNRADDLSNLSKLMMNLDPACNQILLQFEYVLDVTSFTRLKTDVDAFLKAKPKADPIIFLKQNHDKYFGIRKKTVDVIDEKKFIDLDKEKISLTNVINFKCVKANRDVSNKEPDKSLSSLSSRIYKKIEAGETQQAEIDKFKNALLDTDDSLGKIYDELFKEVIEKVKKFGGIKPDETIIKIVSTLQHRELLDGNTTVMYEHGKHALPENYNGLGYMNLISMIFEIELLLKEFQREKAEGPADINLLFIEEPEAHTHPQMQYIFIKNIKDILRNGITSVTGSKKGFQYIISTHSSHIVAESDFNDIKYLKKNDDTIIARNLRDLEKEYIDNGEEDNFRFLKQYLTLHRAELFFADKAIFIEGDTERILLPAMMKKADQEVSDNPLLSQNISLIEVGNYAHIFERFIDFVGIKSLVITDIDSAMSKAELDKSKSEGKKGGQKVKRSDARAEITLNASLVFFYEKEKLTDFIGKTAEEMTLAKISSTGGIKKWTLTQGGHLTCVYQVSEKDAAGNVYAPTSFEDAFIHVNRKFIIDNKQNFKSLKNIDLFDDAANDAYDLAENCINKKPSFAIEILLNSKKDLITSHYFSNWQVPDYIHKGLLWLKG